MDTWFMSCSMLFFYRKILSWITWLIVFTLPISIIYSYFYLPKVEIVKPGSLFCLSLKNDNI